MAGTGHMNAVNRVLQKNLNKTLQRRKDYKKRRIERNSNTKLDLKKPNTEELELIKNNIKRASKKYKQKMRIIFVLLTILVVVLFYFLFNDFNIDFSIFSRHY